MRKITIIILLVFTSNFYAQKIENIEYGKKYDYLKNLTYYELKDEVSTTSKKEIILASLSRTMYSDKFAFSSFPKEFVSINSTAGNKYVDDIEEKIMKQSYAGKFFQNGVSKNSHKYLQLLLEKFETLTNYHVGLYNYNIDKRKMLAEIEEKTSLLTQSYNLSKKEVNDIIVNDNEINSLITEKENIVKNKKLTKESNSNSEILKINSNYKRDFTKIENEQKTKIKSLPLDNYGNNKQKIIKDYKPKFERIRIEKNKKIAKIEQIESENLKKENSENERKFNQSNLDYSKKISERKNLLQKQIDTKLTELNLEEKKKKQSITLEIKERYKLSEKRTSIGENYEKSNIRISGEIEKISKVKNKSNKIKKGVKSILGF